MTLLLQRPGGGLAPFDVPLRRLGPGHYYAPLFDIPYPGRWDMIVRARVGPTEKWRWSSGLRSGDASCPDTRLSDV